MSAYTRSYLVINSKKMAVHPFTVVAVLPGRTNDYFEFWKQGIKRNAAGVRLHPDDLFTEIVVYTSSQTKAEDLVRRDYPMHTVDSLCSNLDSEQDILDPKLLSA